MRIAYVTETYPPELNGVSLTVERTVRFLRSRGHNVELIRPRQPGEAPLDASDELRTAGCPIPVYREMRFGVSRIAPLVRRFRATAPELVHLATPGPLAWAALAAARALGIATTSEFRTNFHQYSRYYGLGALATPALGLLRRFHNLTEQTFVPTRATARELGAVGFHNLTTVGRGVDAKRFAPEHRSAELRRRWLAESAPVLLMVGRVAPEKNIELGLRAFESVRRGCPGLRMVVVGDGPALGRMRAAHPDVHFAGVRRGAALAAHYASADLFLFPSLTDTFGNVVLEALASGLPVVSFAVAAAAEHAEDGVSGRLVAAGDEAAFIAAVRSLSARGVDLGPMRAAAVAAAQRASWPEVLARFESRLEDTLHALETLSPRVAAVA
jgi:glycosyltransferase involved in cell wall biosynthesis